LLWTWKTDSNRGMKLSKVKRSSSRTEGCGEKSRRYYLAADPDREGEAICWHLQEELKSKKTLEQGRPGSSVSCQRNHEEVDRESVRKGRLSSTSIWWMPAARRVLDRLVGYKISPCCGTKFAADFSAGPRPDCGGPRHCRPEREVRAFVKQEYWTLDANLAGKKAPYFDARLSRKGKKPPNFRTRHRPIRRGGSGRDKFIVRSVERRRKAQSGRAFYHVHAPSRTPP